MLRKTIGLIALVLALTMVMAVGATADQGGGDDGHATAEDHSGPGHDGKGHDHGDNAGRRGRSPVRLRNFVGSNPKEGPNRGGALPGGRPWRIDEGEFRLREDGRVRVKIEGLVFADALPGAGTARTVDTIKVSLFCGTATTPSYTSPGFALSDAGDARLRDRLATPLTSCATPLVLVNLGNDTTKFIARSVAGRHHDDDD